MLKNICIFLNDKFFVIYDILDVYFIKKFNKEIVNLKLLSLLITTFICSKDYYKHFFWISLPTIKKYQYSQQFIS
jgi:hypothetical protein